FEIPPRTRALAAQYIRLASPAGRPMLAAYQPRRGTPTPTMTAQMLYTRMLLGEEFTEAQIKEASDFLTQDPPNLREPNLYYWYYSALCMLGVRSDQWRNWNTKTRDAVITLQEKAGPNAGSWNADPKYADRGGRAYMTAIGCLTLEVYYRYQPLR